MITENCYLKCHSQADMRRALTVLTTLGLKIHKSELSVQAFCDNHPFNKKGTNVLYFNKGEDYFGGWTEIATQSLKYKQVTLAQLVEMLTPEEIKVELNSEYTAIVTKEGVKVGCQSFPTSKIRELAKALDEVEKGN